MGTCPVTSGLNYALNVLFQKRTKNSPLLSFGHLLCYAEINIKVSKNYGTYLILGSKKTLRICYANPCHVALSLHYVPLGSANRAYTENPLQEFSQIQIPSLYRKFPTLTSRGEIFSRGDLNFA